MVDVRGDVLRPPHGTTPAAVKSNKNQKWDPLRAMKTFMEFILIKMSHDIWTFLCSGILQGTQVKEAGR